MILLDANILLYAFDASSPRHDASRGWLERTLSGSEVVGFPLVTILAFIRIGTDPRVFDAPLDTESAIEIVSTWLARPNAQLVEPTARHWQVLAAVSGKGRARGPTVTDAHLSALAIEHGATLCTTDRGFGRFHDVETLDPTA